MPRSYGWHTSGTNVVPVCTVALLLRFAAHRSGLASGLALAVRPAGLAEVSGAQGRVPKIVSAKRLETIFGCP
jgi:hypothetical protein